MRTFLLRSTRRMSQGQHREARIRQPKHAITYSSRAKGSINSLLALAGILWASSICLSADDRLGLKDLAYQINVALDSPTDFDFPETPLTQAIDYFKSKHGIEIQIDGKALADGGIDLETPITKTMKGISLRSALNSILSPIDLTCILENEVLLITTKDAAKAKFERKVYDVSKLLGPDMDDSQQLSLVLLAAFPQESHWPAPSTDVCAGAPCAPGVPRPTPCLYVIPFRKTITVVASQELQNRVCQVLQDLTSACRESDPALAQR